MTEVKIDIQRTGFPVKISAIELWFDSSLENIRRFINVEEVAQKKIKEAQEKARHIHFPEDVENINAEDLEIETIDAAFDVNKEFIAAQYDVVFGDGTFAKIYKQYPDIIALDNAMDPLFLAISEKIKEQEKERRLEIESKKSEYLNKKKLKK